MIRILAFFVLFVSFNGYAQMGKTMSFNEKSYINKEPKVFYNLGVVKDNDEYADVVHTISNLTPHFKNDRSSVILENFIKGRNSKHYTFEQTYGDVEVFNSQIKVNIDNNGRIYCLFDNSFDAGNWPLSLINDVGLLDSLDISIPFIKRIPNLIYSDIKKVIFADGQAPIAAFRILVRTMHPSGQWIYILDSKGGIVFQHDVTMYYQTPGDTIVKGKVYIPDPLTSARVVYDSSLGYCNDNYSDNPALTAQEISVDINAYHDKTIDSLYLYNNRDTLSQHYLLGHTGGSIGAPFPVRPFYSPDFLYTRHSQSGFLYTNMYYWLNRMRKYMDDTLNIGDLLPLRIHADAMADSADNSDFLYGWGNAPSWFEFGIGGVPDAEDADVILHEHGHFVSYSLAPNSVGVGFERNSVDEGQADYWAASYSRFISKYHADWVFNWDGHNCFWPGRMCNTADVYRGPGWSQNIGIHHNGQIWSTAMMDIWKQYGRDVADRLMIQANMGFVQNMTMPQAAYLVKQADTILYKGIHAAGICNAFTARNLFNGLTCTIVDTIRNSKKTDTLKLTNTVGFSNNSDFAVISSNKYLQFVSIKVYNISGQTLVDEENLSGNIFYIKPATFVPGIYFVDIITPEDEHVYKLVKLTQSQ